MSDSERSEYFYRNRNNAIVGIVGIISALALCIVLMVFGFDQANKTNQIKAQIAVACIESGGTPMPVYSNVMPACIK